MTFNEFSESRKKCKSSMVARDTPYLMTDTLLDVVVKRNFHYYLYVDIYYGGEWQNISPGGSNIVIEVHVLLPLVMYLLSDMWCFCNHTILEFLSWFTEFSEFHLGKSIPNRGICGPTERTNTLNLETKMWQRSRSLLAGWYITLTWIGIVLFVFNF